MPKLPDAIAKDLVTAGVIESAAKIIVNNPDYFSFITTIQTLEPSMVKIAANDLVNKKVDANTTPEDYLKTKKEKAVTKIVDESILKPIIEKLVSENQTLVGEYKAGKTGVLGFFVGGVMKVTGGKADASVVNKLLLSLLWKN